jgi:molecular chaperone DnaK
MLKEHRDKVSPEDAKAVEDALESTRKAIADGGVEDINKSVDNLTSASHKLAEAMYKSASATPPQGEAPKAEEPKKNDDVVDAEFVDVDDKEKK